MEGFDSLDIPSWLKRQCAGLGWKKTTPVQSNCIPPALDGKDVLGCAKTGSGKTAAFAIPILTKLSEEPYGIFALVLSPTRELASQIVDQFNVLGKPINVRVSLVVGGMGQIKQTRELESKPHIVVATPGRLADILKFQDSIKLSKLKFLVLDEADQLFRPDIADDLSVIINKCPVKRQTLMFSATLTSVLTKILEVAKNEPFQWTAESDDQATVAHLDQKFLLIPSNTKDANLVILLKQHLDNSLGQVIVFVHTCLICESLSLTLHNLGVENVSLNSLKRQKARLESIAKFKSDESRVLLATDVASRGLDIPKVRLVINYDTPNDPTNYIHRVGRTARAGAHGMALTLVSQFETEKLKTIEAAIGKKLDEMPADDSLVIPVMAEVAVSRKQAEVTLKSRQFFDTQNRFKRARREDRIQAAIKRQKKTGRETGKKTEETGGLAQ